MSRITITEKIGGDRIVTVDKDQAEHAITPWFPDAPEDVRKALFDLQTALDRNEYTGDLEVFLGIEISQS